MPIFHAGNTLVRSDRNAMAWDVRLDAEFSEWLERADEGLRDEVLSLASFLAERGPRLGRPYVDTVEGSAFTNMKELRVQYLGDPYRVLFAFDPQRSAILLVGGNKRGDKRWYKRMIPIADERFRRHLESLDRRGPADGDQVG